MRLLRKASRILSTYTADVSGVASALYEMGGMTVIHDASGCNSTYNTHDEPRWYDIPSMVYISALAEVDALMGSDEKLIDDVSRTASELRPRFVALAGTPIPAMTGTDLPGIARVIENRTGIPCFGFPTSGMNSYDKGAGMALAAVARRFCPDGVTAPPLADDDRPAVNLLGVTPLDFSVTGNAYAFRKILTDHGFRVVSCWAMQSSWERLMSAGCAHVNIIASSCGAPLAHALREIYGTPFVTGLPIGQSAAREFFARVEKAARDPGYVDAMPCAAYGYDNESICAHPDLPQATDSPISAVVIGEPVQSSSAAYALERDCGLSGVCAISPLGIPNEAEIFDFLKNAKIIIADPLYRPAAPPGAKFIPLPHEAYSGRIYRDDIPLLPGVCFNRWIKKYING